MSTSDLSELVEKIIFTKGKPDLRRDNDLYRYTNIMCIVHYLIEYSSKFNSCGDLQLEAANHLVEYSESLLSDTKRCLAMRYTIR